MLILTDTIVLTLVMSLLVGMVIAVFEKMTVYNTDIRFVGRWAVFTLLSLGLVHAMEILHWVTTHIAWKGGPPC